MKIKLFLCVCLSVLSLSSSLSNASNDVVPHTQQTLASMKIELNFWQSCKSDAEFRKNDFFCLTMTRKNKIDGLIENLIANIKSKKSVDILASTNPNS